MRRTSAKRGVTLMEVVLAVTLTAMVLSSAMVFYRHALKVRREIEAEIQTIEAQRMIMDRMTNELRGAMSYRFLGIGMEGESDNVLFIGARVPGPAAWAIRKSTEDPIPPEHDLQLLGYQLRTYGDEESGEEVIGGLERTCQKSLAVEVTERGGGGRGGEPSAMFRELARQEQEIEATLLSAKIRFIAFRYWRDGIWLESLSGSLPMAVEITMGSKPLPEETEAVDYPYPVMRRIVYMPGAARGRQGTIIRGLGGRR